MVTAVLCNQDLRYVVSIIGFIPFNIAACVFKVITGTVEKAHNISYQIVKTFGTDPDHCVIKYCADMHMTGTSQFSLSENKESLYHFLELSRN